MCCKYRFGDDDTGIVDEDRQRPELGLGRGDSSGDAIGAGDVAGDRQAVPPGRGNLASGLVQPIDASRGKRDLGAGSGEELGQVPPDPARCAGDERDLASEVEARQFGHGAISLACSRSSNFWILPVEVFGNGPKITVRGSLVMRQIGAAPER